MRKIQLFFLLLTLSTGAAFSQACVIDTNNYDLFSPASEELPCVVRDSFYDVTLQLFCPPGLAGVTIDSIRVTAFHNLPTGLSKTTYPPSGTMYPQGRMCIRISGTTTDTTGYYEVLYDGMAYTSQGNAPFSYLRMNLPGAIPDYALTVINQGDACPNTDTVATGITKHNRNLGSVFSIFPNPTNGVFEFNLNTPEKTAGEINVMNVTGQLVFSQKTNPAFYYHTTINISQYPRGIYFVEYRTVEGVAVKKILVE